MPCLCQVTKSGAGCGRRPRKSCTSGFAFPHLQPRAALLPNTPRRLDRHPAALARTHHSSLRLLLHMQGYQQAVHHLNHELGLQLAAKRKTAPPPTKYSAEQLALKAPLKSKPH